MLGCLHLTSAIGTCKVKDKTKSHLEGRGQGTCCVFSRLFNRLWNSGD